MNFEKNIQIELEIESDGVIVCCSGTGCTDNNSNQGSTNQTQYDNSYARSKALYGPKHDSTHSCTDH